MRAGGHYYPALVISTLVSTTSQFEALQKGKGAIIRLTLSLQSYRTRKELNFSLTLIVAAAREYYTIMYKGIPLLPSYILTRIYDFMKAKL